LARRGEPDRARLLHGARHARNSRPYSHFVFGALQSGLTCLIAAGIASPFVPMPFKTG
jgi:hypothetical protein